MKTKLLKISLMMAALMFVFTGASWADSGKNRHGKYVPEKRIASKGHGGSSHHQTVHYRPKINRHPKHFYKNHHRPVNRYRHHKFYHRNRWIHQHRPHDRQGRYYSENSYDDDASSNEFSVSAIISEPGVEFSIGTKRTW
ncbi:MAG: hypothetical protein WBM69_03780 [Desulfobacterales bacterium]